MPKLREISKRGNSSEQIVNLLYNTGYRLTGSHRETQKLLKDVFNALNGNINLNTALKSLCLIYINKATSSLGKNSPKDKRSLPKKNNSTNKVQEALLTLPPAERLVLVLREVLGLGYVEIAEMTGIEKTAVTRLLNTGRWALRKQLVPPPGKSRQPEKYSVAK
ncbi:RNA polymerase sigma factor [Desulfoscipio gibsoniae]|uniref:DNA-directed RNA polymerase specialized sigma subunit, sigma24 n=1 Tax=Desulfoscipio gibsoniae DSM 7213 TaxID=767817 RepID=R4KLT7_9FIRM|nr:RNA polymerase sigma factor [Desulfoscipio gibsoniae]AGL02497.1 DNA-directed RNA polymerase specialized sigma subunit, sigma24 [Desulfoscipio gibsoniae DSM 7213]